MTRSFHTRAACESCGHSTTIETPFERWMRADEDLDSRHTGLVRFDLDVLLHRYKFTNDGRGSRSVQAMMFIEVKSFMAEPTAAQADTLGLLDQVLRNRRPNIHSTPRRQVQHTLLSRAYSLVWNREVDLWLRGGHLLQMETDAPRDGELLLWDKAPISVPVLKQIFRFEIDADTLYPVDMRRRYRSWTEPQAEAFPDVG